ncbi:hypothetical protein [Candidatus Halobonum tyrrellensis]|uniref:DUF8056 domain-containing protein n=1 Tax=Candidatus Halobonum tyrrellensis G22 TaxID=1324957 RepID=V4H9K5_9EURY|nr:hypothetical protein [Candidatus Halobonum tyrrellensis]ESP87360.1 hypothetical protein K933_14778 [Candidatus Halobonum tyrrellensis G22]
MTEESRPAGTADAAESADAADPDRERSYGGVVGAFPYAFRSSESWLFRSYALVGGAAAAALAVLFALALVQLMGATAEARFSVVRAFFILVGLAAVAPTVGPVLFVARAHRRGDPVPSRAYDAALGVAGYVFLLSLYLGVVAAMPATFQLDGETVARPPPSGAFAPAVGFLYALPSVAGLVVPTLGAALVVGVHRLFRS